MRTPVSPALRRTGSVSAAAVAAVAAAVLLAPGVAGAAPSPTSRVTIDAASPAPVNVPALNKAFTSELITVSAGRTQTTSWCDGGGCETTYSDGVESTNTVLTEPDATDPNAQIGSVLFRVGNGPWTEITSPATVVPAGRPVELAYNDVSGAFDDNSGHYTVTIVRNR